MALDTGANTIAELDQTEPPGSASAVIADDNFRAIKRVLKNIFPGVGQNGFDIAITATEEEINHLSGVTSPVQDQINTLRADLEAENYVLHAPLGTRLILHNKQVPDGWVSLDLQSEHNLVATNIADISDGSFVGGGTSSPTVWSHNHQVDIVIPYSSMPRHRHDLQGGRDVSTPGYGLAISDVGNRLNTGPAWPPILDLLPYTSYEGNGDQFSQNTHTRTYDPRYTYVVIIERQD